MQVKKNVLLSVQVYLLAEFSTHTSDSSPISELLFNCSYGNVSACIDLHFLDLGISLR
jgi:hypothetical protein